MTSRNPIISNNRFSQNGYRFCKENCFNIPNFYSLPLKLQVYGRMEIVIILSREIIFWLFCWQEVCGDGRLVVETCIALTRSPCASLLRDTRCAGARTTHAFCQSFCCARWRGCDWRSTTMATRRCGRCWTPRARHKDCLLSSHTTTTSVTQRPGRLATGPCGLCVSDPRLGLVSTARIQS